MDKKQEELITQKVKDLVIKELSSLSLSEIETSAEKALREKKAKDRRKKVEKRAIELLVLYSSAEKEKLQAYKSLIEHLAFIDVMIAEYREDILDEGFQTKYQNGKNQWGIRRSEAVDLFKKWYSERLSDSERLRVLLGVEGDAVDDDFDAFIAKQKNRRGMT